MEVVNQLWKTKSKEELIDEIARLKNFIERLELKMSNMEVYIQILMKEIDNGKQKDRRFDTKNAGQG